MPLWHQFSVNLFNVIDCQVFDQAMPSLARRSGRSANKQLDDLLLAEENPMRAVDLFAL